MSAQPVQDRVAVRPHAVLDAAIGTARAGERFDLVDRLSEARHLLRDSSITVQVVGGAQQGRTSMVDALLRAANHPARLVVTETDGDAADAAVFVSDAAQPLSAAELDLLRTLSHRSPTVVFALTKIDLYPHWREVLDADLDLLRSAGVAVDPFAVSAHLYLHARTHDDAALASASGVAALADRLHAITDHADVTAGRAVAQHVLSAITELDPARGPRAPTRSPASRPRPAAGHGRRPGTRQEPRPAGPRRSAPAGSSCSETVSPPRPPTSTSTCAPGCAQWSPRRSAPSTRPTPPELGRRGHLAARAPRLRGPPDLRAARRPDLRDRVDARRPPRVPPASSRSPAGPAGSAGAAAAPRLACRQPPPPRRTGPHPRHVQLRRRHDGADPAAVREHPRPAVGRPDRGPAGRADDGRSGAQR